jgi:two-component system nitrogen regulation response regulator NtrX
VALLAGHFLADACRRNALPMKRLDQDALERLRSHAWPGNVRELKNVMERAAILVDGLDVREEDLSPLLRSTAGGAASPDDIVAACRTIDEFLEAAEKHFLIAKLKLYDFNISKTADEIEMARSCLHRRIAKYGIK